MEGSARKIVAGLRCAGVLAALVTCAGCDAPAQNRQPPTEPPAAVVVPIAALAQEPVEEVGLIGRTVGITDGDTLTVLVEGQREMRVRLAEIDAPERGQPWGTRARQTLSELVYGQEVRVVEQDVDRWGRTVARVYVGETDVNARMVELGAAWAYTRYLTDRSIAELEDRARRERVGLWSMPTTEIVEPWEWRGGRRGQPAQATRPTPPPTLGIAALTTAESDDFQCGTRRLCREMRSCQEARYHLQQCGLRRLDGDGDGVPCESLC